MKSHSITPIENKFTFYDYTFLRFRILSLSLFHFDPLFPIHLLYHSQTQNIIHSLSFPPFLPLFLFLVDYPLFLYPLLSLSLLLPSFCPPPLAIFSIFVFFLVRGAHMGECDSSVASFSPEGIIPPPRLHNTTAAFPSSVNGLRKFAVGALRPCWAFCCCIKVIRQRRPMYVDGEGREREREKGTNVACSGSYDRRCCMYLGAWVSERERGGDWDERRWVGEIDREKVRWRMNVGIWECLM